MTVIHRDNLGAILELTESCSKPTWDSNCPIEPYRNMPLEDRWDAIRLLSADEAQAIMETHATCSYNSSSLDNLSRNQDAVLGKRYHGERPQSEY